ncbi:methylcrotonoyl-CoA carboxylase subunit alpha, mitochondrial [Coccinella septempunctata]|uniref:methylcrotonoyl-CoA carboxylase subunit alpha, mitochondrial n=1 Tax=Coccinella septempunctata TaxID=41139 RepID=UPI001D08B648|nr:methylcrotonoyl-CoA carboxylase subunit alpha, mitochondrial [Coccinella septempunctata]
MWQKITKLGLTRITLARRWKSHAVRKVDKLLIANRGEIACRIMKTAKRLGVRTVAVFSEADKKSLHVEMADEAYNIGPPPSAQSYLRGDYIIEVAKRSKCSAIHPGYGFLSENVEFAGSCEKNNIIFVGPPASAIRDMGIKSTSKAIMSRAGVPVIGGYHGEDQSLETLSKEASKIGFPVMIKAVRGGGGKGMRIALTESEFEEALESAKTESQKSFGDSVVLLEKFIQEPRHVEVQVFADKYGNAVHLFERDCSVQRRHQKIIEEAPAPGVTKKLRNDLGKAAVQAAKAVGYVGAGTVEFILDRNTHNFHFMEMNTRLQVEHPITEMITGTDLVEWQLRVASGEELPLAQDQIKLMGHAFEARIYAENPREGFLPGAGNLKYLVPPQESEHIRIETGVRQGDDVSVFYDPMIAKLVVWGEDRSIALARLRKNLLEYNIAGLETNVNFLLELTNHKEFKKGHVHTNFIRDYHDSLFPMVNTTENEKIQAALATILFERKVNEGRSTKNPFVLESNFRVNHYHVRNLSIVFDKEEIPVQVKFIGRNNFEVSLNDGMTWHTVSADLKKMNAKTLLTTTIDDLKSACSVFHYENKVILFNDNGKKEFSLPHMVQQTETEDDLTTTSSKAVSPMPGIIDKIFVGVGDTIRKGDNLFVLIAMKMEHIVKAPRDAKVAGVHFKPGDNIAKDAVVVAFEEEV